MIIELEGCSFRIAGESNDWQIQYPRKKNGEVVWEGKYFYVQLEYAVAKAYELALRESKGEVDIRDLPDECRKVADKLAKAVKRAVAR